MNKKFGTALIAAFTAAATISIPGAASPVTGLTAFTPGTPAKAAEVNGNFAAVKTAVDDNSTRIGALEARGVNAAGNLILGASSANSGNILKDTELFIHNAGVENTFVGLGAGNLTLTGVDNTAAGYQALLNITSGNGNAALSAFALQNNTSGSNNTAVGAQSLQGNTTGANNSAFGYEALQANSTGNYNTASGAFSLNRNTVGTGNTAAGYHSLLRNTTGDSNVANGAQALENTTTGYANTATGFRAMQANIGGYGNSAYGESALLNNTSGGNNAGVGKQALYNNTSGSDNVAIGVQALFANTTGYRNIAIGLGAGNSIVTGHDNIIFGDLGAPALSNTIVLGRAGVQSSTFIAGIRGVATGVNNAIPVYIDSEGQLGTLSSSRRVKDDIADMGDATRALMKLRPVTFFYKSDKGAHRSLQYGLVAEEVAEVAPSLVAHSANGEIETVYYQFLAPMLLNEYQKQQRTIEAQTKLLTQQTQRLAMLERQSVELAGLKNELASLRASIKQLQRESVVASRN